MDFRTIAIIDDDHHVKTSRDGVHVIIMAGKLSENSATLYFNRGARGFFQKAY